VQLIADLETPMGVRIGIGALFESLAEHGELDDAIEALGQLTQAEASQVRADAAYYLGLSHSDSARRWLEPLLEDENHEVREIAAEALAG
jgi:HEAT repeat protein